MSLIFCDGFDDELAALGKWNLAFGAACSIDATGRNGKRLRLNDSSNGIIKRKFDAADEHATLIWGFAWQFSETNKAETSANSCSNLGTAFSDGGATTHVSISAQGGTNNIFPTINAYRGPSQGGTLLGSSAALAPWVINVWYYVECKVVLHDTTGSIEVKLNGTTVLNLTNIDTKNGGTKTVFDSLGFGMQNQNDSMPLFYDDLYVLNGAGAVNNNFLGDTAVETLYPNGNGSQSDFLGSDGNSVDNYLLVDEAVPSTVDYVQSNVVGDQDLYAFQPLVRTSGTVYGVQATSYAQASDSGTRSVKNLARSGTTTEDSTAQPLVTTWLPKSSVFETDPDTAAAWSIAGVNGAEFGVEVA